MPACPPLARKDTSTASTTFKSGAAADPPTSVLKERREEERIVCGGPIWWNVMDSERFTSGWLVERSAGGAAFLTRGQPPLQEGTGIKISTSGLTDVGFGTKVGRVSRIQHVHADLFLVAAETDRSDR